MAIRRLLMTEQDDDTSAEMPASRAAGSVPVVSVSSGLSPQLRHWIHGGVDAWAWMVGITLATGLRYELDVPRSTISAIPLLCLAVIAVHFSVAHLLRLYRGRWNYGTFDEVVGLATTVAWTSLVLVFVNMLTRAIPISASLAAGPAALVIMAGIRIARRESLARRRRPNHPDVTRVLVFGAGEAGSSLIESMVSDPASTYLPVGLLDDDPAKRNLHLHKVPVVGTRADLAEAARAHSAEMLVIALPNIRGELVRSLYGEAVDLDLEVRVLPSVRDMLGGVTVSEVRKVSEADLLGRGGITTDVASIAHYLTGKRVLVTGAGGSIGSELCRQVHGYNPASLVMVDRDESGLHGVQMSIEGRALLDDRRLVVADIRDRDRMAEVFAEFRPEVVFHAAALKHLPLLEMHPMEAVKTNVGGTQTLLDLAAEFGVGHFVNISTDKAANPTSVLGYSKRIAERLTADAAHRSAGIFVSVRFGNVLGSSGSMLRTFTDQIANGGPITVTDPEVTRFFMTVAEAVELVVQAGAIGRDGEVLVLDMGEPVKIDEVAHRLIAEAHRPIQIVYTGLRPGEKLHEDLWGDGEPDDRPVHPLISHVPVPRLSREAAIELLATESSHASTALRSLCNALPDEDADRGLNTQPQAQAPAVAQQPLAGVRREGL
jgi:FlaA1/EpsC-like NDP-sugar epimerase